MLTGKALANEIEEGADPRGAFQVGVGHDPQFASQVRHWTRQRADEVRVFVAEIAGQQRQTDAGLRGDALVDEAIGPINEGVT